QPMPLSPKEILKFGYRSSTAEPTIADRMLTRFIWKPQTPWNSAARRASGVVAFSRTLAGVLGNVWKWSGRVPSLSGRPRRLPRGMPHGIHVPRARELEALQPHPRHASDLLHGGVDVSVGQAGQADLPVGIVPAEVLQPVVVDPEHLLGRLVVVQARGCAEDAEDDLGLHAVELHVLQAQVRIGRPPDALLAVLVEPDRGHLVDAIILAGHQLGAARADAADQTERRAVLASPVRTVGAIDDVRHALAHRRRSVGREQVVGNPGHV